MNKAESGSIGGLKRVASIVARYNANPKTCSGCNIPLEYSKRNNKYCTSSCSAKHCDKVKRKPLNTCIQCGTDTKSKVYCSIVCQHEKQNTDKLIEWKQSGVFSNAVRKFIFEKYNNECSVCQISEWQGKPLTLELEHVDGNSDNNTESNLTVLCPNCHSQTSTYKGRNIGNGRHVRRTRYANNKSY